MFFQTAPLFVGACKKVKKQVTFLLTFFNKKNEKIQIRKFIDFGLADYRIKYLHVGNCRKRIEI